MAFDFKQGKATRRKLGKRGLGLAPRVATLVAFSTVCLAFSAVVYVSAVPALMERSPVAAAAAEQAAEVGQVAQDAANAAVEGAAAAVSPVAATPAASAAEVAATPVAATATEAAAEASTQPAAAKAEPAADASASSAAPKTDSDSTSDDSGKADSDSSSSQSSEEDSKWRNVCVEYYNTLSGYVSQYNVCTSEFSSLSHAAYDDRKLAHWRCEVLINDLYTAFMAGRNANIPSDSKYCSYWENQQNAYLSLADALDCMDQAWEVSLTYDDPTGHEDEINAKLANQQAALDEFNGYYSKSCPA